MVTEAKQRLPGINTVGQALRVVDTRNMNVDEWREKRRQGIGGSAISAIAGVNPWSTPFQAYLEIIGELETEENEAMYWGNVLESVVADEYKRRHPEHRVERVNAILQHPDEPVFIGNIDRRILGDKRGPGVLEVKTTSAWMGGKWRDDVPDHVTCQAQWYLGVTGYKWATVAVLIGGNQYEEFAVERDDEIIEYLQTIGRRFWEEHVVPRVPPVVEAPDADVLADLYPEDNGEEIELPPTAQELLVTYHEAKEAEKEAQERRKEVEAKLKNMLGENEQAVLGDWRVRWSTVEAKRLDSKALKAEMPDIYDQFVKTSMHRRFSVSF